MGLKKKKVFLVIGSPGSGKTSVCNAISISNLLHFSIGEMYRNISKENTPLGDIVKKYIEIGQIVPIDIAMEVIHYFLKADCAAIIIDGFPRDMKQAKMFSNLIEKSDCVLSMLIEILVDEKKAFERISKRNRGIDDRKELFKDRLGLFKKERNEIIDYYADQNKYISINGNLDFEIVASNLKKIILSKYKYN